MQSTIIDNRYEILEEIGKGSLGVVYKAKRVTSDYVVAIKVFSYTDREDIAYKRLMRSIETSRVLSHPNVLAPIDTGFIETVRPYVVMEYCQGVLLSDVLKRVRFLTVDRAVSLCAQICDALDHAHYYGCLHRNLKPSNIMIIRSNTLETAKVLDFGLAKSFFQCNKEGNMKLTIPSEVVGTPEFMSPEQCKQAEVDWRSDIYSMGCLAYTMLAGRPPILGDSPLDTIIRQGADEPLPFERASAAAVPQAVQNVIFKALSKDKESRQQTMVQLRDELFQAAGLVPGSSQPVQ